MNEELIEKSCKEIKDALLATGRTEITGAILGELIRKAARDLDVREAVNLPSGPGAVSRFADKYLQDILVRAGSQGSDKVYKIINSDAVPKDVGTQGSSLWHAFVKPRSPARIFLSTTNKLEVGEVQSGNPFEVKAVIPPATSQELDDIRSQFANELRQTMPTLAQELEGVLQYSEWSSILKKGGREQVKNWANFRIEKITQLFESRLSNFEVSPEIFRSFRNELHRSQNAAYAGSITQRAVIFAEGTRASAATLSVNSELKRLTFREAVIRVISDMSDNELRELRLPAGELFEVISGKNNKS